MCLCVFAHYNSFKFYTLATDRVIFKWGKTYIAQTNVHHFQFIFQNIPLLSLRRRLTNQSEVETDNKINKPPSPDVYQTLLRGLIDGCESKQTADSKEPEWTSGLFVNTVLPQQ